MCAQSFPRRFPPARFARELRRDVRLGRFAPAKRRRLKTRFEDLKDLTLTRFEDLASWLWVCPVSGQATRFADARWAAGDKRSKCVRRKILPYCYNTQHFFGFMSEFSSQHGHEKASSHDMIDEDTLHLTEC